MKSLFFTFMFTGSIILCIVMISFLVVGASFIGFITTDNGNQWTIEHAAYAIDSLQEKIEEHVQRSEDKLDQHVQRSNERLDDFVRLAIQNHPDD